MDIDKIAFYVVQNAEGKFFRRKGYGGSGETWVESFGKARVWTNITGAKSTVTFFANHYPKYPPPKIIKLTVGDVEVIDETERLAAMKLKKQKQKETQKVREAKQKLNKAKEDFENAKANYEREQRHYKGD